MAKLGDVPFLRLGGNTGGNGSALCRDPARLRPWLQRLLLTDAPGFTSIFQGALRWNSFIALGFAANLYGTEGVTLTAVAISALIPLLNVLCVFVLRRYGTGEGSLLRGLATNPFIIGTLAGLALNLALNATGPIIPRSILMALDIVAQCALGSGLLLVGAGLRLQDMQRPSRALIAGVALKLLATPVIGYGLAIAFGLTGKVLVIAIICLGVPTASACYLLARKMGGDAPLMAAITTAQTLASMVTLPLLLAVLT